MLRQRKQFVEIVNVGLAADLLVKNFRITHCPGRIQAVSQIHRGRHGMSGKAEKKIAGLCGARNASYVDAILVVVVAPDSDGFAERKITIEEGLHAFPQEELQSLGEDCG